MTSEEEIDEIEKMSSQEFLLSLPFDIKNLFNPDKPNGYNLKEHAKEFRRVAKRSLEVFKFPDSIADKLSKEAIITSELSRGGMGKIFKGIDFTGRDILVKTILYPPLADEKKRKEILSRFEREGKVLAALNSEYIVPVYTAGVSSEKSKEAQAYLTMKPISGKTLAEKIKEQNKFSQEEVVKILLDISKGLKVLHDQENNIIHRDLKPNNLVYDEELGHYVIIDFGLAKTSFETESIPEIEEGDLDDDDTVVFEVPPELSEEPITQIGARLGTPLYMSPEQFKGGEPTKNIDLYALGVIAYRLLSKRMPFKLVRPDDRITEQQRIMRLALDVIDNEYIPIEELRNDINPVLKEVVDSLLSKNPADRGNAQEVIKKLEQIKFSHKPEKKSFWSRLKFWK